MVSPVTRPALLLTAALLLAPLVGCKEVPRTYSTSSGDARVIFKDDFNRGVLGKDWHSTGAGVKMERGALHLDGLRNHPVWLTRELPDDLRVEFDAWAETDEGDIKIELAGDGQSHADPKVPSYTATGYVLIFGGWNNRLNVIARQDEHGDDRVAVDAPHVEPDRRYHFVVTRREGEIRWEIDGELVAEMYDDRPLVGEGHQYFAFNNWEAPTHFDNLVIYALE